MPAHPPHIPTPTANATYQKLRITNPIKYGEELVRMYDGGHTQKEIAETLSCNRQMVGRYQRMGKWPEEVKAVIQSNRDRITNTKILNLASRALTDKELLAEVRAMVGDLQGDSEVKTFPTVNGFNELITKLESIENRLIALETLRPKEFPPSEADKISKDKSVQVNHDLTWQALINAAVKPASVLLMVCIVILTAYLIYQGVVFFSAIDPKPISATSSALVSELIPFVAAACFALAIQKSHRAIALGMLLTSIVGLGVFMHNSLRTQLTQNSGRFERLTQNRELTLAAITAFTTSRDTLPETYVSKRQDLAAKIATERQNLAEIDHEIDRLEAGGGDLHNMDFSYAVWLRIAAMLLNAYLVHLFFTFFRKKSESLS